MADLPTRDCDFREEENDLLCFLEAKDGARKIGIWLQEADSASSRRSGCRVDVQDIE